MLNVEVTLGISSATRRKTGGPAEEVHIITLQTLPDRTYDLDKPVYGRWSSKSIYLGKYLSGPFIVAYLNFAWDTDREYSGVRDQRIQNPVGQFFDTEDDAKRGRMFLSLYSFAIPDGNVTRGFGWVNSEREPSLWPGCDWNIPIYGPQPAPKY